MRLTDILRCPRTGKRLRIGDGDSVVRAQGSDLTYPIVDGIIDFCPDDKDTVSEAYDAYSSRYDKYMSSAVSPGICRRVFDRIVWGFSGDGGVTAELLSHLPSEFDGVLLDVPVGTALFTRSRYAGYPKAAIVAIDYSMRMLQAARMRFPERGVKNVHLIRADVANLPIRAGTVDILPSMSGLHAFAERRCAIKEMRRTLHEQGTLLLETYVGGVRRRADWIVEHLLARRGFFTLPLLHICDIVSELGGFTIRRQGNFESCAWFEAVKNEMA